jgi:hypothetical protein
MIATRIEPVNVPAGRLQKWIPCCQPMMAAIGSRTMFWRMLE